MLGFPGTVSTNSKVTVQMLTDPRRPWLPAGVCVRAVGLKERVLGARGVAGRKPSSDHCWLGSPVIRWVLGLPSLEVSQLL